jgi:hypothetical protein
MLRNIKFTIIKIKKVYLKCIYEKYFIDVCYKFFEILFL